MSMRNALTNLQKNCAVVHERNGVRMDQLNITFDKERQY